MKECEKCKKLMRLIDFYGNNTCYKCSYKLKVSIKVKRKCRICGGSLNGIRAWAFCSKACGTIGHLKQKREYWTNKIKVEGHHWRGNRFLFNDDASSN